MASLRERGGRQRPQAQPQHSQWTWERFCREEAREAASAFLERVRRFKGRQAAARDVHDSTFTNEFSAAFLEESSILMANVGETTLPTTNGGATLTTSLPSDLHNRVEATGTRRRATAKTSSPSKSSWWSGLFKWPKSKRSSRERGSSNSSSSSTTASTSSPSSASRIQSTGSTKQKRKQRGIRVVKETPIVQLLNLSESDEGADWSTCKLMLVEQQENYQLEIYSPPKNAMPKMSLFCFLIDEVRSTTPLEMPDSNTCFAIKSENQGEYVFDVKNEQLKEEWIRLLQTYTRKPGGLDNGQLPARSSQPSSHLATLPRAPSAHSSPNRSHDNHMTSPPISALDSSPLLVSRTRNTVPSRQPAHHQGAVGGGASRNPTPPSRSSRHLSISEPRSRLPSLLNANSTVGASGSEESVLVDMGSFMRSYAQSRSPNRQRKTLSLFVDPATQISVPPHITPNPYVPAHSVSSAAPTSPTRQDEGAARFPYASPRDSPPPPVPRRSSRPHSMFVKNANIVSTSMSATPTPGGASVASPAPVIGFRPVPIVMSEATPTVSGGTKDDMSLPMFNRPLPAMPPIEPTPHPLTPGSARPLPATPTESAQCPPLPAKPRAQLSTAGMNSKGDRGVPKRKISQPTLEVPVSPRVLNGTTHELPSPGNLETCSQSSSSSALHPVSLAALSRQRKSSIPFTPTEEDGARFPPSPSPSSSTAAAAAATVCPGNGGGVPAGGNVNGVLCGGAGRGKKRVRKISAPTLMPEGLLSAGPSQQDQASALTPTSPAYVVFNGKERDFSLSVNTENTGGSCCGFIPEGNVEPPEASAEGTKVRSKVTGKDGEAPITENGVDTLRPLTSPVTSELIRDLSDEVAGDNHTSPNSSCFSTSPPTSPGDHTTTTSDPSIIEGAQQQQQQQQEAEEEEENGPPSDGEDLLPPPLPARTLPLPARPRTSSPLTQHRHPSTPHTPHTPPPPPPPPLLTGSTRDEVTSVNSIGRNSSTSTHSISSLDERDLSVRTESVTSNPIFVETSQGQEVSQPPPAVHTRHPYEYWATNQQDVTNMRMLSQYPWFHGMISRANASQLVVNGGDTETGQYLVRQSESREGDFVLTFNYHNRAKHLRMTVDNNGCNIQHLWFDSVPSMLDYFRTNSIPLESFWLNDDVKLTNYIHRQASDAFRTTTILNVDQLNRMPPRRSRSLHLGMSRSVTSGSSHPSTPSPGSIEHRGSSSSSASTNSLPHAQSSGNGWRGIFRSQRSSSAGNVGRIQRSNSHNAGSVQGTGRGGVVSAGGGGSSQPSNPYVWRNY